MLVYRIIANFNAFTTIRSFKERRKIMLGTLSCSFNRGFSSLICSS